ncbi:hypothetical protein CsSME_00016493 [Camellia sinensis var. sinensis]
MGGARNGFNQPHYPSPSRHSGQSSKVFSRNSGQSYCLVGLLTRRLCSNNGSWHTVQRSWKIQRGWFY